MRQWMALAAAMAATGCQKPGTVHGDGNSGTAAAATGAGAEASVLTPGEWEITTVAVPQPGAPGQPEPQTGTQWLSVEDAADPGPRIFGECQGNHLQISGGHVSGHMPCHGDGALSRATVSVTGSYARDRFQITIDTHFMGHTVREEKRGRLLRPGT